MQMQRDINPVSIITGTYLTRDGKVAMTAEQLNAKGEMQRAMEVGAVDLAKRTVELAFSSEYEGGSRWFGIEILDHSPSSIDLSRLRDGGALLLNHDWDNQIGVVESVTIGADKVGRAVVRFSKSDEADEIFHDVADGIRKHVSVGYRILAAKLEETREDGTDVYRVTSWQPFEISIVPVPFDPTVGVGRSAEKPPEEQARINSENPPNKSQTRSLPEAKPTMNEKILRDAAGNLVRAQVNEAGEIVKVLEMIERAGEAQAQAGTRAADIERKRGADILAMGDTYGCAELARKAVAEGTSVDDFTRTALEHVNKRSGAKPVKDNTAPQDPNIGLTDGEARRYSFFKVVRALANPNDRAAQEAAAFELECSRAAESALGKTAQGMLVPDDVLQRAFNSGGAANSPTGATSGSNLVAQELRYDSFIEMLRKRTTIMRLAQTMGGLVGNVDIPKQTAGATAYWVGEGADATEGTPTIAQLHLSPKTVAAYSDITRKLLQQSTPDAEGIVRRDLVNAMSQEIDRAGWYGTGASNQPRGLKNVSGINGVDFAATNPTYAELVAMESAIATANADVDSMAYVLNANARGAMKTALKFSAAGSATLWESGNTMNGYRTEVTNQLINGDYFFGNFADMIVGMWGGLDLTVDPYSLSKSGGLRIVVFQDVDFIVRRTESFTWGSSLVVP